MSSTNALLTEMADQHHRGHQNTLTLRELTDIPDTPVSRTRIKTLDRGWTTPDRKKLERSTGEIIDTGAFYAWVVLFHDRQGTQKTDYQTEALVVPLTVKRATTRHHIPSKPLIRSHMTAKRDQ